MSRVLYNNDRNHQQFLFGIIMWMMMMMLIVVVSGKQVSSSFDDCNYQSSIALSDDVALYSIYDPVTNMIRMEMTYQNDNPTWLGIGFTSSDASSSDSSKMMMIPNIAIIGIPPTTDVLDDNNKFSNSTSLSNQNHVQRYNLTSRNIDGVTAISDNDIPYNNKLVLPKIVYNETTTILSFRRPNVQYDSEPVIKPNKNITIIWAVGMNDETTLLGYHTQRGYYTYIMDVCSNSLSDSSNNNTMSLTAALNGQNNNNSSKTLAPLDSITAALPSLDDDNDDNNIDNNSTKTYTPKCFKTKQELINDGNDSRTSLPCLRFHSAL